MHCIRQMWNATSRWNVETKSNFRLFQSQIRQSRPKDVPSQSRVTSRMKLGTREDWRLSWVMITVSNMTKNTGRYVDTYSIFYITVNFTFNLRHYVTRYTHHTGKKESKKENRMTVRFSPCSKGVFSSVRKNTLTQYFSSLFPLF